MKLFWKKYWIWIAMIAGLLFASYRLRYFFWSPIPLGYDPWMYKWIFTAYINIFPNFDFSQLPSWIRHEPLLGIIMGSLWKIGINYDRVLTRWIGIINIIPGILIYILIKKENKRIGMLAARIYRLSCAQYQLFWRWYLKQAIAINILLLLLLCIQNKKILWQWILFFVLIILHKHTALYAWALLIGYMLTLWSKNKRLPRKEMAFWMGAGMIGMAFYIPLWSQIMPEAIKSVQTTFWGAGVWWDFMTKIMYLKLERLIIIISWIWAVKSIFQKKIDIYVVWYLVGFFWILLGLVNFNRTIVFFDIFVSILAAYALYYLIVQYKKIWIYIVGIWIFSMAINYIVYVNTNAHPLISMQEFSSIKDLSTSTEKNAIIMSTHRNYTPWIMWRSQRDSINPWMSELNIWNHAERNIRWSSDGLQKCAMLKNTYESLHRPLYIWMWNQQLSENMKNQNCLIKINENLTKVVYPK